MKLIIVVSILIASACAREIINDRFEGYHHFLKCVPDVIDKSALKIHFEPLWHKHRQSFIDNLSHFESCESLTITRLVEA